MFVNRELKARVSRLESELSILKAKERARSMGLNLTIFPPCVRDSGEVLEAHGSYKDEAGKLVSVTITKNGDILRNL